MKYTTFSLIKAAQPLFNGHKPTIINEPLNIFISPKDLRKQYTQKQLKNIIYITPHISTIHRNNILKVISNAADRLIMITPNQINCHWMKLIFNSTNAVCIMNLPPTDIYGLIIKREWIALTYGISQTPFLKAMGQFGSIVTNQALERGGNQKPLTTKLSLQDDKVINPASPKPKRKTLQEIASKQRQSKHKLPKPSTLEELGKAEFKINQQINDLKKLAKETTSDLSEIKIIKKIRSLQSKKSQYRRYYRDNHAS